MEEGRWGAFCPLRPSHLSHTTSVFAVSSITTIRSLLFTSLSVDRGARTEREQEAESREGMPPPTTHPHSHPGPSPKTPRRAECCLRSRQDAHSITLCGIALCAFFVVLANRCAGRPSWYYQVCAIPPTRAFTAEASHLPYQPMSIVAVAPLCDTTTAQHDTDTHLDRCASHVHHTHI